MEYNTDIKTFDYDSLKTVSIQKSKTPTGIDIISTQHIDNRFYMIFENTGTYNIIDYQGVGEVDMCNYTKLALLHLSERENIIISNRTEALNSVYWNSVFYILQEAGYKNILWIDGGLTKGELFRHIDILNITHIFSDFFFGNLFRSVVFGEVPVSGDISNKNKLFVCISRMARQERFYFTSKILKDIDLFEKGILSCAWSEKTLDVFEDKNLNLLLDQDVINRFPITLNHKEIDESIHGFYEEFSSAIFHIVQESSVGYDHRTHRKIYNKLPIDWRIVNSDRLFFTEKSAKPFCCNQIPLFIAAPGYVEILRNLGFDLFDDIVDHNYDKEDNVFNRCDLVYKELKRISEMHTTEEWLEFLKLNHISERFVKNRKRLMEIKEEQDNKIVTWVRENF